MIFKIKLPILSDLFGLDTDDKRPEDLDRPHNMKKFEGCVCACVTSVMDSTWVGRWDG